VAHRHNIHDLDEVIGFIEYAEQIDRRIQVSPQDVAAALRGNNPPRLCDVRTRDEWELSRIEGATLITEEELAQEMMHWPKDTPIVFYCHQGQRRTREERSMADFVKVAKTHEIEPGQAQRVTVGGKDIALFNVDGQFFALDNTCTHRGGSLVEGELSGHEVTCPLHGATFDIQTGEVLGPPAQRAVARYGVRVTGTDIEVEM
jgi:3-phenylpropionate/trans-cinnamate dioxygenase ferredoxin subunit